MTKWEYTKAEVSLSDPKALDWYGSNRWEAFAVDFNFRTATMLVLFKRPLQ